MRAYVWAFDHPYAAVTKEDGTYEIPNVPAGAKVRIVAWHEVPEFINGGSKGEEITIKDGDPKNFSVKAK